MSRFNDMPVDLAIELYFEKHQALRMGDLLKLIELKKAHPDIFVKENDAEIRDIILHAKAFENSEQYKELRRQEVKDTLSVIDKDEISE